MTKEKKDKIFKALAEDRNDYVRDCNMRIAKENGKITGADYMIQRFLDVLRTEVDPQETEAIIAEVSDADKRDYDDAYYDHYRGAQEEY